MLMASTHRKPAVGFTLIEVLVTIIIVSIGLLGLAGLQINGLRANMSSEARSKATLLASDIIERMRANPLGVDSEGYNGIHMTEDRCGGALGTPFCSNYNNGAAIDAVDCTPAQMAAFDAWVWACGMPVADDVQRAGVTNQLINGVARVSCNATPCVPGSSYTVTVSWDERRPNATDTDDAGDIHNQDIELVVTP
jgi:type IV pilus assembly protein PilV